MAVGGTVTVLLEREFLLLRGSTSGSVGACMQGVENTLIGQCKHSYNGDHLTFGKAKSNYRAKLQC